MKKKFYLPGPVYELIPFVYSISGISLFLDANIVPPKAIGILLFLTGILIIKMRIKYRFFERKS